MLRFMDGFDHYPVADIFAKWTSLSTINLANSVTVALVGNSASIGSTGRNSSKGLTLRGANGGGAVLLRKSFASLGTWLVGAAIKIPTIPTTTQPIISFYDNNTLQFSVSITSAGLLCFVVGGTAINTGTTAIAAGSTNYIEVKAVFSSSVAANAVQIHLNGVLELTLTTATNTASSGTSTANAIVFVAPSGFDVILDDVYICDTTGSANNTFLGDVRVECLFPSGAGTTTGWTPTTGANYAAVNEASEDGDTKFIAAAVLTTEDTYAMADLSSNPVTIMGVQTVLTARKDDAGTRSIAAVVRSGGTDYSGATVSLGDSYAILAEIRETDPATSSAWTQTGVNGMEAGVKLVG